MGRPLTMVGWKWRVSWPEFRMMARRWVERGRLTETSAICGTCWWAVRIFIIWSLIWGWTTRSIGGIKVRPKISGVLSSSKVLIAWTISWRVVRVRLIFLLFVLIVYSLLHLILIYKLWILEWFDRHIPCFFNCNSFAIRAGRWSFGTKNVSLFVTLLEGRNPIVAIILYRIFLIVHCWWLAWSSKGKFALKLTLVLTVHFNNELVEVLLLQISKPKINLRFKTYSWG